jgi:hypothetical protein
MPIPVVRLGTPVGLTEVYIPALAAARVDPLNALGR